MINHPTFEACGKTDDESSMFEAQMDEALRLAREAASKELPRSVCQRQPTTSVSMYTEH